MDPKSPSGTMWQYLCHMCVVSKYTSDTFYPGGTVMRSGLGFVLVGSELFMTGWLKFGPVRTPNSCGHDTGGGMCVTNTVTS